MYEGTIGSAFCVCTWLVMFCALVVIRNMWSMHLPLELEGACMAGVPEENWHDKGVFIWGPDKRALTVITALTGNLIYKLLGAHSQIM